MKLTKSQLKQIIKEELEKVLNEFPTKVTPGSLPKKKEPPYLRLLSKQAQEDWDKPDEMEKSSKRMECEQEKLCYDEKTHSCIDC
jgi:hypothetical protein